MLPVYLGHYAITNNCYSVLRDQKSSSGFLLFFSIKEAWLAGSPLGLAQMVRRFRIFVAGQAGEEQRTKRTWMVL